MRRCADARRRRRADPYRDRGATHRARAGARSRRSIEPSLDRTFRRRLQRLRQDRRLRLHRGVVTARAHKLSSVVGTFVPPGAIGWHDDGAEPALVIEDHSGARWPPPWSTDSIVAVMRTLEAVGSTPPPPSAFDITERGLLDPAEGWEAVRDDRAQPCGSTSSTGRGSMHISTRSWRQPLEPW
jgi:hypothetical protein